MSCRAFCRAHVRDSAQGQEEDRGAWKDERGATSQTKPSEGCTDEPLRRGSCSSLRIVEGAVHRKYHGSCS